MAFFKKNSTWLWLIVFIILIIIAFGMKKCENMTENLTNDCNVCGGFCTCPSCLAHNSIFDDAFVSKVEHFASPITKPEITLPPINGHTDNIYHATAAPLSQNMTDECDEEVLSPPAPYIDEPCGENEIEVHMMHQPMKQPIHQSMYHSMYSQYKLDKLKTLVMDLSKRAPEILNKCTPGLLQSLIKIAILIGKTNGNVNQLKLVEPSLTNEFNKLNMLLKNLNKNSLTCLETQTNIPLSNMMCKHLNNYDINELQRNVNDLEYVNEMLKSQKHNFRQMRDLLVVRMKNLVNKCDVKDPVKRNLQLHSIDVISQILHSLGYIFQDDTLKSQLKMLNN